jgi:hypothetical protein
MERQELIKKIEQLPSDRLAELENFVESITNPENPSQRTRLSEALTDYAMKYSGAAVDAEPLLDERRTEVREIVEDVLEEAAITRAIDEGVDSGPAARHEILDILENSR